MAIIHWQPFPEIDSIRRQMDRVFDEMTGWHAYPEIRTPAVELHDEGDRLILRAELPGIDPKHLDISVTRELVTLQGERRHQIENKEKGYFRSEFHYGRFERAISLPVPIQNDKVVAEFKDGILTLTLPKVEETQNRAVKINLASLAEESPAEPAQ